MINEDGDPTPPFKVVTGTKPSISNLHVLFCPCFVQKATEHVGTKALNMRHQAQKSFQGIFVGTLQQQKGYLVYVPHKYKIVSLYDVFFYGGFFSVLLYTSQTYSYSMAMGPEVSYLPYATSSKEQTINIITFAHFE